MTSRYELVAVARIPQAAAPPTLTEIGPIVAPTIIWTDGLNQPGAVAFSCTADRLASDVRARFLDVAANPTEVWLYRDGVIVAAGIVEAGQVQGGILSCTCPGLLHYLAYMHVVADVTYTADDQFAIAAALVEQWQSLSYGDFGIDTSGVGTSGITLDRTYLAAERHEVLRRVLDLGARVDGFDTHVDPATRALALSHPLRGTDLTSSVVLDARNITDGSFVFSVAPGDLASEALGVGTLGGADPITSTAENTTLRQAWGRTGVTETFDGVDDAGVLGDHTERLLDDRTTMVSAPGPGLLPVADADVGSFGPGDEVTYSFDSGLGTVTLTGRIGEKRVTVDEQGNETMAVSFATARPFSTEQRPDVLLASAVGALAGDLSDLRGTVLARSSEAP